MITVTPTWSWLLGAPAYLFPFHVLIAFGLFLCIIAAIIPIASSIDEWRLKRKRLKLESENKNQSLPTLEEKVPQFDIGQIRSKLFWREEGKEDLHPFTPEIPIPENAPLVLLVIAQLTSGIPFLITDIELETITPSWNLFSRETWFSESIFQGELQARFPSTNQFHMGLASHSFA